MLFRLVHKCMRRVNSPNEYGVDGHIDDAIAKLKDDLHDDWMRLD